MSAPWGNPENIYSPRVLPHVTLSGSSPSNFEWQGCSAISARATLRPGPTRIGLSGRKARAQKVMLLRVPLAQQPYRFLTEGMQRDGHREQFWKKGLRW